MDENRPEMTTSIPAGHRTEQKMGVKLTFLGDLQFDHVNEATLSRDMIVNYVQQLFMREDFPKEIFVILVDNTVATKGDVVWANLDNEHPYDFVPMPCIDQLILNLPSKEGFLEAVGARDFTEVKTKSEKEFWEQYRFEFASQAEGMRLKWE